LALPSPFYFDAKEGGEPQGAQGAGNRAEGWGLLLLESALGLAFIPRCFLVLRCFGFFFFSKTAGRIMPGKYIDRGEECFGFLDLFRIRSRGVFFPRMQVLDATSDEPWGPHGSDLADIARATKR